MPLYSIEDLAAEVERLTKVVENLRLHAEKQAWMTTLNSSRYLQTPPPGHWVFGMIEDPNTVPQAKDGDIYCRITNHAGTTKDIRMVQF